MKSDTSLFRRKKSGNKYSLLETRNNANGNPLVHLQRVEEGKKRIFVLQPLSRFHEEFEPVSEEA